MYREALKELGRTLHLALPMITGMMGGMSMGLIDAAMVGHSAGTFDLSALGFGTSVIFILAIPGYGMVTSLSVLIAQAYGANEKGKDVMYLRHGLVITLVYSSSAAVLLLLLQAFLPQLGYLGQTPLVAGIARPYIILVGLAFVGAQLFACVKAYWESQDRPWLPLCVLLSGLLLNVFLNWVFINGHLGAPKLNVTGAGMGTLFANIYLFVAMVIITLKSRHFDLKLQDLWRREYKWAHFRKHLSLGIPSSLQILFEVGMFAIATLLMGRLGPIELAAHHVTFQIVAYAFSIPLGYSFAVTIRIGQAAGRKSKRLIQLIGYTSLISTLIWMCLTMIVLYTLRHPLVSIFSNDQSVLEVALRFITIAAIFQVFDGTQIVATGALRGLGDVNVPMYITLTIYWFICLPLAYLFAFPLGYGGVGIWIALAIGIVCAATALSGRFRYTAHKLGLDT